MRMLELRYFFCNFATYFTQAFNYRTLFIRLAFKALRYEKDINQPSART